jgi:5'-nucleotidase
MNNVNGETMHILVTNDDGVYAPGIFALQTALRTLPDAKVTIMAPAENQSAVGHRKTLRDPMRIDSVTLRDSNSAWACSGSPADAIALALMGFIKEPVDLVVSGINHGPNLAQDITYSGTVTAAMEAVLYGIPAIAISLDSYTDPDFETAATFATQLAPVVLKNRLPELTLLNVNVPVTHIRGVQVTKQGRRIYHDELVERVDPMGRPYYWIGGGRPTGDVEDVGTDVWALAKGYISITPIHLDLTAHDFDPELKSWNMQDWDIQQPE